MRLSKLLVVVAVPALVAAKNCNVDPAVFQIGNVTIMTYEDLQAPFRAMRIKVGTGDTERIMAAGISTGLNLTFIPDSSSMCTQGDPNYKGCVFWRGGLYGYETSKSFVYDDNTQPNANGSASNDGFDTLNAEAYKENDPVAQFRRGWDTVRFGDDTTIEGYPLSIITDPGFPISTGSIGMATNSVFLKSMVSTGNSPSMSWSYDVRSSAIGTEVEGEFIVGGYNTDKVSYHDFTNYTVFENKAIPCPLQVKVKRISWGDNFDYDEPFLACIDPGMHTNTMPQGFQKKWNNTFVDLGYRQWQTEIATWQYMAYNRTNTTQDLPQDNIVVELEDGFTTNIVVGEMVKPAAFMVNNPIGGFLKQNNSIMTFVGAGGSDTTAPPVLNIFGRPFLSQIYLAVNYEDNVFSLAKSPQSRDINDRNPQVRKLGCDDEESLDDSALASGDSTEDSSETKSKTGIIAGAVCGGAGLLLILAGIFFFFTRKKKQDTDTEIKAGAGVDQSGTTEHYTAKVPEVPGSPGISPSAPAYDTLSSTGSPDMHTGSSAGWSYMNSHQNPGYPTGVSSPVQPAELGGESSVTELPATAQVVELNNTRN